MVLNINIVGLSECFVSSIWEIEYSGKDSWREDFARLNHHISSILAQKLYRRVIIASLPLYDIVRSVKHENLT